VRLVRHLVFAITREATTAARCCWELPRVKRAQGTGDVWEIAVAADGRATFAYGDEAIPAPHVIWRRAGSHDVLSDA